MSDNIKAMTCDKADDVIKKLFESVIYRYQVEPKILMKSSDFIFNSVDLLNYKCLKINFKRDGSYIQSPDCIKNEKAK